MQIYFIGQYAVQFITEGYDYDNIKESYKNVVGNLENGFPVFQLLRSQAGLRVERAYFQHLL